MREIGAGERYYEGRPGEIAILTEKPRADFVSLITERDIRRRLAPNRFPSKYLSRVSVIVIAAGNKRRARYHAWGMQWGSTIYLYPVPRESMQNLNWELDRAMTPREQQEARKCGAIIRDSGRAIHWTVDTLRRFYLENILIHEIGHCVDYWNHRAVDRERFAEHFADRFGFRA